MRMGEIRRKKSFWKNVKYNCWFGELLSVFTIPGALKYMEQTKEFSHALVAAIIMIGILMLIERKAKTREEELEEWSYVKI